MSFLWTKLQYVGGHALFDLINTVCYANDPELRHDRLTCAKDLLSFVDVGIKSNVWPINTYALPEHLDDALGLGHVHNIRSSLDELFRGIATNKEMSFRVFNDLLKFHIGFGDARAVDIDSLTDTRTTESETPFVQSIVFDAIRIAVSNDVKRVKQCPRCHWLFLDKSRNQSRVWCSMATCGNVAKAKRFASN